MKKILLLLLMVFTIGMNAQYAPATGVNYIKFFKTPPTASPVTSDYFLCLYRDSDKFMYKMPSSVLNPDLQTVLENGNTSVDVPIFLSSTSNDKTLALGNTDVTIEDAVLGVSAGFTVDGFVVGDAENTSYRKDQIVRRSGLTNVYPIILEPATSTTGSVTLKNPESADETIAYLSDITGGTVATVTGTINQIDVDNTDPANLILSFPSLFIVPTDLKVNNDLQVLNDAFITGDIEAANFAAGASVSGTNTGDQTNLTGFGFTKANLDAAISDGNAIYVGDNATKLGNGVVDNTEFDNLNGTTSGIQGQIDLKSPIASPTFTGTVTTPAIIVSGETANTIASFDGSKNIKSLSTGTYPSLTELAYVKGLASNAQTQLNTNASNITTNTTAISAIQTGYTKVIGKITTVGTPNTGTTAETIIGSIPIASGEVASGNQMSTNIRVTNTGSSGTKTIRVYLNTTNDMSGTPLLVATNQLTATFLSGGIWRIFNMRAGGVVNGVAFNISTPSENSSITTASSSSASFAYTGAFYIIITGQLSNSGDSIAVDSATITRL